MNYDVKDFQTEVVERSKQTPVLVDFWAEWCGPCKILGPILERLAGEANGSWKLAKVNTEELTDIAERYGIRSIPNVKLFIGGKVETEFTGALPEPMVRQWLAKNIPSPFQKDIDRAEQMVSQKKTVEARDILHTVLKHEPGNHRARALLARMEMFEDTPEAQELVKDIEQDSEYFEMAEAIRTFAALSQKAASPDSLTESTAKQSYLAAIRKFQAADFAGALEGFIDVIRNDRYYDDDGSRKACIAIFKVAGEESEVTKTYRREFSRALY